MDVYETYKALRIENISKGYSAYWFQNTKSNDVHFEDAH